MPTIKFDDGDADLLTDNCGRDAYFAHLDCGVVDTFLWPDRLEALIDVA
jgi:hypothetical protein